MIGATYTNNGADWTGLTPTINIYNALSKALVINAAAVPEIAEGGYRYEFAVYDPSIDYYWKIDGGAAITNNKERYRRGWSGLAGAVPDAQAGVNGGLPTVDANNRIAGIQGTKNILDDMNDVSAAQVNAAADTALVDYGGPTKAEMDAGHGLLATEAKQDIIDGNVDQIETTVITNAAGADIAADIIALKIVADAIPTTAMRGTDNAATEAKQDVIDSNVDDIKAVTDNLPNGGELTDIVDVLALLKTIETKRWKIDTTLNQLILYADDNVTPLYSFDLKDANGNAVSVNPTERMPA